MKTLRYIFILLLSLGISNSCLIEDESTLDLNDDGFNLAGFEESRKTLSAIADGAENDFQLKVKVAGPTWGDVKNPVTLTIGADPSSTAVAGTHYKIKNPTITLSPDNNMLGLFTITMLTKGIQTPLAKSPVLVLKVTQTSGDNTVSHSGKPITLTLNYACPSFLEGTYTLTIQRVNTAGVPSTIVRSDEVITKTGIGTYRTTYVGHWTPAQLAPGTPGFTFTDVCGKLTVVEGNLADYWANMVAGTDFGYVDETTGNLYMEYSVCTSSGCNYYKCTYVKK